MSDSVESRLSSAARAGVPTSESARINSEDDSIQDMRDKVKQLEKRIQERQWLNTGFVITVGLSLSALLLTVASLGITAFIHFTNEIKGINSRVDNSHSRVDDIDDRMERVCEAMRDLPSRINGDDNLQPPDCLP